MKIYLDSTDLKDQAYQNKFRRGTELSLEDFFLGAHIIKNAKEIIFTGYTPYVRLK